ncbi:hypothetical protein DVR12_02205 [Chitinophaga silvatica]|uniref:Uncharacterized protein n=1 Tax=Chitinophaga silvatica TaxID=2282649 RepID=A0A3E1YGX9_9BACT|nr:hypothetical protein DVR12_02205 [Chitinophaga silvatica]
MNNYFNLRMWGKPILIGLLSIAGLIAALTGDGIWDIFSWITLSIPLFYLFKFCFFSKEK